MVYLDNAATTFPKPTCVYEAVDQMQRTGAVNAGRGGYTLASTASKIIDSTRKALAQLVDASSSDCVIFTPSATLAANQIILGLDWNEFKTVYITPFEHNAIARPIEIMRQKFGFKVVLLPFDSVTQQLDENQMNLLFAKYTPDYVFLNHVSNVTGVVIPIEFIAHQAKKYGALVVADGSQSLGSIPFSLKNSGIDFLVFAGHKNLYSSWGVGGFVINSQKTLHPALAGGTGMDSRNLSMAAEGSGRFELGSPNIIAIASLLESLGWLKETGISAIAAKKETLVNRLIQGLCELRMKVYMPGDNVLHSGVVSFTHPEYTPDELGIILDQDFQISVRTGFHCAPYIHDLLGTVATGGTIRIGLGYFNSENDIDALLHAISEL